MTICYIDTTIYKSICNLSFCSRHLLGLFGPQHAVCIQGSVFSSVRFDACRNIFARRWVSCHVVIPNFPDATRGDQNASYILVACSHNKNRTYTDLPLFSQVSFRSLVVAAFPLPQTWRHHELVPKVQRGNFRWNTLCRYASACSCHCSSLNQRWGLKEKNG